MKQTGIAVILALVPLAAIGAEATPPDPANSAIEIAMMIGQVQALAEICMPPANSYEPAMAEATRALDKLYANAGLDPGQIQSDISEGRQDETQRHDDISFPLDCDLFPKQVSAVQDHVTAARNQQLVPTASNDGN